MFSESKLHPLTHNDIREHKTHQATHLHYGNAL
jgi:hypothetical protein